MDAPTIAAFASLAVALVAVLTLAAPVYLRLGRLEAEVKAGRERSDVQYAELRERSDRQYAELRERSDRQYAESLERADAQHAETLAEIRRLADALWSHSHAPDGGIIFRIPPQGGPPQPE